MHGNELIFRYIYIYLLPMLGESIVLLLASTCTRVGLTTMQPRSHAWRCDDAIHADQLILLHTRNAIVYVHNPFPSSLLNMPVS